MKKYTVITCMINDADDSAVHHVEADSVFGAWEAVQSEHNYCVAVFEGWLEDLAGEMQ